MCLCMCVCFHSFSFLTMALKLTIGSTSCKFVQRYDDVKGFIGEDGDAAMPQELHGGQVKALRKIRAHFAAPAPVLGAAAAAAAGGAAPGPVGPNSDTCIVVLPTGAGKSGVP